LALRRSKLSHSITSKYRVAAVQAAPAFLDLEEGINKTISLIEEAAAGGASLIAFPEVWLPGYPWWVWLDSPAWGMQFVGRYFANSLEIDSPQFERIKAAARENGIFVRAWLQRALGWLAIHRTGHYQ
jgi:aliphatic nitrilase